MSQALSDAEQRDGLRPARAENVDPVTFVQLIGRFGTAREALVALPDLARRGAGGAISGWPSTSS